MKDTMTSRERILATIRGEEVDRFPVWLKMGGAWQTSQPDEVQRMNGRELLEATGCDLFMGAGLHADRRTPHVKHTEDRQNGTIKRAWETPDGTLTGTFRVDPVTGAGHPTEYPVKNLDDLRMLRWEYTDVEYAVDPDKLAAHVQRQNEMEEMGAATTAGIGPSSLMNLIEHWAGPENTVYAMVDDKELFDETIELMHQDRCKQLEAMLPPSKTDTFWMTENTSTTLLSPQLFEEYCMPQLTVYGNMILENGLMPVHHMCGKLNALLEMIDKLPAMANEAYTTRPVGDASLAEGRTRMPTKALIGGTNATLLLEGTETIINAVAEDIAACPDRRKIFLTSAGVLPATVSIEKAKKLVDGLKSL